MLSARSSSSESTIDSARPDKSTSSASKDELCTDIIVSDPLYAELVSLECDPRLHFWKSSGLPIELLCFRINEKRA